MDAITHVIAMWANEAIVVVAALGAIALFQYVTRVWTAPIDAVLGAILGASIGIAGSLLFLSRHVWSIGITTRASCFIILYLWCVLCMLFFAAKDTSRFKLFIGLVTQGGILYALFVFL